MLEWNVCICHGMQCWELKFNKMLGIVRVECSEVSWNGILDTCKHSVSWDVRSFHSLTLQNIPFHDTSQNCIPWCILTFHSVIIQSSIQFKHEKKMPVHRQKSMNIIYWNIEGNGFCSNIKVWNTYKCSSTLTSAFYFSFTEGSHTYRTSHRWHTVI